MIELLSVYSALQWILLICAALFIGMAKTGLGGLGLLVVPLLAYGFGARTSTGVLLPILIMADVYAVLYYHRMTHWNHVLKLMPWAVAGVAIGLVTGKIITDQGFKTILSVLVLSGLGIMIIRDLRRQTEQVPDHWAFAAVMGLAGGFATMVANAAGPVFAVYLLAMKLPKNSYIGTGAWFFFIINLIKLPLHIGIWQTIDSTVLLTDILLLPAILFGGWLGIKVVKLLDEKLYRILVILMTIASAIVLLLK